MARNYGRTVTSIWRDTDFLTLNSDARFAYVMLFNQPKISAAGVLEVTAKRWADNLGFSTDRLTAALAELVEHRYVIIDDRAEELFVRSFMRHDGGVNNDLRRKAILSSAASVVSMDIRASIAVELDRLGIVHDLSRPYQGPIEARRVVVPLTEQGLDPQPSTPEGGASQPAAVAAPPFNPKRCKDHQTVDIPGNCGNCKDAREAEERRAIAELERGAEARKAQAAAILACTVCDEFGRRLSNGVIVSRVCDHGSSAVGAQ